MALGLMFVRAAKPAGGRRVWTALELLAVGLMVGLIAVCHLVPHLCRHNGYYTPAAALVVYVFARQRGALSRVIGSRPAVYLSEVSFAFYMLHAVLFTALARPLAGHDPFARAALQVAVTFAAAAAVNRWFEVPLRAAIIRLGRAKADGAGPTAPGPLRRRAGHFVRMFGRGGVRIPSPR